jgi:hypothetical protein
VRTEWEPDELIGARALVDGDWKLIANKTGVTRLGVAVMLRFYEIEGRFPAYPEEIPQAAVGYIASLETTGKPNVSNDPSPHRCTDTPMRARRDTSGQKPRLGDADFAAAAYAAALFRARVERLLSREDIGTNME